jgi:hypothetical protein
MDKINFKMLAIYTLMVVVITVLAVDSCHECPVDRVVDTVTVVERDTVWQQVADTMPKELKPEKVVGKVTVPTIPDMSDGEAEDTQAADTAQSDGMQMDVVQRTFSDDSTYTAYVSGIKYQQWPKLDSIIVRQREITNTIREKVTIRETRKAHWNFGVQAGLGVGLLSGRVEPYIGAGVGYSW